MFKWVKNRALALVMLMLLVTTLVSGCGSSKIVRSVTGIVSEGQEEKQDEDYDDEDADSYEDEDLSDEDISIEASNVDADSSLSDEENTSDNEGLNVSEDGEYTSKEEVALYIHLYNHLPDNYITKKEAEALGWKTEGSLDEVAPGKSIGGSHYGNYEGLLPDGDYHECDIDYVKGNRNAKRLIYSDDGRIYYTEDHYETFEQLY